MDAQKFRVLSPRQRALVAVAVLIDGREAESVLALDAGNGRALAKAAGEVASQSPDLRMPFLGTLLRSALQELDAELSGRGGV